MKKIQALALASFLTVSAQAADLKFAVIDMTKAFSEYYKTKDAATKMKANKDKAVTELQERYASYKTLMTSAQKLGKEANDPILAPESRQKAGADFQSKQKEVRAMEQEISDFQQRRQSQLRQEEVQLQRGLYQEIVKVVEEKSKRDNFDFVFDKTGVSMSTVPVLLYYKDATDITSQVIVELNKNAPADSKGKADVEKK
jgi:outer membrane protein